jgi:hypothetical protein
MGVAVFPAAATGGIKSVQRGLAGAAGTVTITSVDTSKSFVQVYGTASSGVAALSGNMASGTISNWNVRTSTSAGYLDPNGTFVIEGVTLPGQTISGGTTTLVTAVVQGYLSNSTSLVVSGACRWEVVEFN